MNRSAVNITSTRQERMEQYSHTAYRGAVEVSNDKHFAVIPPGVNRRIFSPESAPSDEVVQQRIDAAIARDIAQERRNLPCVVCSSRLDRKKNHLGLARAFAQSGILQATANLAIVVRGLDDPLQQRDQLGGEERAILNEIAAILDDNELWGIVTSFPLNNQMELAAAYRHLAARRSVFALTALYEPFGLAPLEAMSCGLPAVVTRSGGPSESMREGNERFGVLVDPTEPSDIARGLIQALMPKETWRRYQEAGIQRVVARYTWERTAENYLCLIEQILANPIARGSEEMLPIPPYFRDPQPANDITLKELEELYFGQQSSTH
jgi:sucrose-phosphate synthase